MRCIVDCRIDKELSNNYLELSLWGRPCYAYVVDAVKDAGCFSSIEVVTDSSKIRDFCEKHYSNLIVSAAFCKSGADTFTISGRAPCISSSTINQAAKIFSGIHTVSSRNTATYDFSNIGTPSFYKGTEQQVFNAFRISRGGVEGVKNNREPVLFNVSDREAIVINTANDFELALIMKKKQENKAIVHRMIEKRIEAKENIFANALHEKSICLVGHSQLDQWNIEQLAGYKVRNCGISGISSFEYDDFILKTGMLNCSANVFIVMHGTNDIVWEYTIEDIVESIKKTIDYIKGKNRIAPIIFLSCLHTKGRMDRNNKRIDELNNALKDEISDAVIWLDTTFMDDKNGDLRMEYTSDGLHINETGYFLMHREIERMIRESVRVR